MGTEARETVIRQFSAGDIIDVCKIENSTFFDAWNESMWLDEKQGLTFCHTKTIMRMWRNKNRYGEDRKTKVGKCKKESVEYPGGRFYV